MPPVVPGGPQLRVGGLELRKPGYVRIKDQYIVHTDMLKRYDRTRAASRFYLDTESFRIVLKRIQLMSEETLMEHAVDETKTRVSCACGQETAEFGNSLANGGESDALISAAWDEWDRSSTIRSPQRRPQTRNERISNPSNALRSPPPPAQVWQEWDRGIAVAGITSDRPSVIRSPQTRPRTWNEMASNRSNAIPSPPLHARPRPTPQQRPPVQYLTNSKGPEDSQPSLLGDMVLIIGGIAVGTWLGYTVFRAMARSDG